MGIVYRMNLDGTNFPEPNILQNNLINFFISLDKSLNYLDCFGFSLEEVSTPFVKAIEADGAIPYVIGKRERYRSSPLSSTLFYMNCAGLLPQTVIEKMQEQIIFMRDFALEYDPIKSLNKKKKGDELGWDVSEGVSIWTTSMALLALLDTNYSGIHSEIIIESTMWLVNQQNKQLGGWAFQNYQNCEVNIPMTALALKVLGRADRRADSFIEGSKNDVKIRLAIKDGLDYLIANNKTEQGKSGWFFKDSFSFAGTIWAIEALTENHYLLKNQNIDEIIQSGINSLLDQLPYNANDEWKSEIFVSEAGAKYDKHKNFYSFMPVFIPSLICMGVPAFHPKILPTIKWLINNRLGGWRIERYEKENPTTFSYAMGLYVLTYWLKSARKSLDENIVNAILTDRDFSTYLFSLLHKKDDSINLNNKRDLNVVNKNTLKIFVGFYLITFFCFSYFTGIPLSINVLLKSIINRLIPFISGLSKEIIISICATVIIGIMGKITKFKFIKDWLARR